MNDTRPIIGMVDRYIGDREIWVTVHDGEGGFNRSILLACARNATTARLKAKRKFLSMVRVLEKYGDC